MDGSEHPKPAELPVSGIDATDPFASDQSKATEASFNENHTIPAKRQHENDEEDSASKKSHIDVDDPEELDLDALLAQLQKHTDRAKLDDTPDHEPSEGSSANAPDLKNTADTELSIEQQLKGALSSLQELEGGNEDEEDDARTAFAIDELSNILKSRDEITNEYASQNKVDGEGEAPKERSESLNDESSTEQNKSHSILNNPSEAQDISTDNQAKTQLESGKRTLDSIDDDTTKSRQSPSPSSETRDGAAAAAAATTATPTATPTASSDSHDNYNNTNNNNGTTAKDGGSTNLEVSTQKRESLLSKMPPLPTPSGGTLPPMPPPPAAFTSPTAPLTALELSRNSRVGSSALNDFDGRPIDTRLHRMQKPVFSDLPTRSKDYEASIVDQVDKSFSYSTDGKEEPFTGILLNDSQSILQSRQKCIILLDALACQVLDFLSFSHYQETLATVMQPDSERGMAYRMLLDAFEDVKRMYFKWKTESSRLKPEPKPEEVRPFLPYSLPGLEPTRENMITLQRANMATFVAAIFGTIEIGFWELDDWFLKVFVPINGRLFKQQATIYLDLKTQAYISAVESTDDEEAHKEALDHLFPKDLEAKIQDILGERMSLAPSEQDFVEKCHRRRDNILAEEKGNLSTKYHWVPFLREISDYISRNHYTLLPRRKFVAASSESSQSSFSSSSSSRTYSSLRSNPMNTPVRNSSEVPPSGAPRRKSSTVLNTAKNITTDDPEVQINSVHTRDGATRTPKLEIEDGKAPHSHGDPTPHSTSADPKKDKHDKNIDETNSEKATKPSDSARRPEIPAEGHPLFPPLPKQVLPPPSSSSTSSQNEYHSMGVERSRRPGPRAHSEAPVAANSPTDTLAVYEAAKASAEGTDAIRPKTSMFTTRRVWTKEEEEALLKGMDRVQGPYWAQILELYGPGGKINEVLKDRTQVQLKDKARNLKMFFVRLGLPIPAVFQYVTGDYETRRSSGKKIRDRKQQVAAGPSSLSREIKPPSKPESDVSALQPSSRTVTAPEVITPSSQMRHTPGPPQHGSSNPTSISSKPEAQSEGSANHNKPSEVSEPTKSLVVASPPHQQSSSDVKDSDSSIHTNSNTETDLHGNKPSKEGDTLFNELDKGVSEQSNSVEYQPKIPLTEEQFEGKTVNESINNESQARESHGESNNLASSFVETGDKDDDLASLINRVGEYVENH